MKLCLRLKGVRNKGTLPIKGSAYEPDYVDNDDKGVNESFTQVAIRK